MIFLQIDSSALPLPPSASSSASSSDLQLKGFSFASAAAKEETRQPRIVRVGLVQNKVQ